jgi:hypothetical protein
MEQYLDIRGVCAITKLKEPTIWVVNNGCKARGVPRLVFVFCFFTGLGFRQWVFFQNSNQGLAAGRL